MKIVFILSGTILSGGATKSFLNLQRYLVSKGDDLLVITPDKDGVFKTLYDEGIKVVALKYGFNTIRFKGSFYQKFRSWCAFALNYINSIRATKKLLKLCNAFHPDIIHSNTSVNLIGYEVAKKMNIPHIWHIREYGDLDFGFIIPRRDVRLKKKNNYSICITKGIAIHTHCLGCNNSRVIYNGIISEIQCPEIVEKSRKYFLYAGRIERAKGLLDLIEAYDLYQKKCGIGALPLKVMGAIGEQWYYDKVKEAIQSYRLSDKIEIIGEMPTIEHYARNAKAVIIPSYNEGFGRVAPESMALGTLVIGRDSAGTKEQFDNGLDLTDEEIGIRFSDINQLASTLYFVAEEMTNEQYISITNRAKRCVLELYSSVNYGKQVRDYYSQILKR